MGCTWQTALTAVFLEGIVFVLLSFFNVREAIIKAIPFSFKKAVAAGIGLFIALIGLNNSKIIISNESTLVALGNIKEGSALVAIIGLIITIILFANNVRGSILIGIFITAIIGIPFEVTNLPKELSFASFVSLPAAPLLMAFDFSSLFTLKFFTIFFTFLFVDIFDTIGTLMGVTTQAGLVDKNGNIPRVKQALLADAIGTVAGAALGTSTVTSYVESAAGVAAGGRTGLTSLSTAFFFFLALFLSPVFLIIPSAATTPALVLVGFLMIKNVIGINFNDPSEGIPAFMTIIMMPFAYSIAQGIVFGILSYVIIKTLTGKFKDIPVITWIIFIIFFIKLFLE
jgi:AGZA family xanthine/uracil permease-like MFS transporter